MVLGGSSRVEQWLEKDVGDSGKDMQAAWAQVFNSKSFNVVIVGIKGETYCQWTQTRLPAEAEAGHLSPVFSLARLHEKWK